MRIISGLLVLLTIFMVSSGTSTQLYAQNGDEIAAHWSGWTPDWSPDGNFIAFASGRSGNQDIWIMNADGSNSVNLTSDSPRDDSTPHWSPDGRYIMFQSNRNNSEAIDDIDIWVMNADGSSLTNLTEDIMGASLDPAWSPDGNLIAFRYSEQLGTIADNIGVISVDGTGFVNLTPDNTLGFNPPVWSPDGDSIIAPVWNRAKESSDGTRIININDLSIIPLTTDRLDFDVAWSPDGSRIAIIEDTDETISYIWLIAPDGTGLVNVTPDGIENASRPLWSPDGTAIVFVSSAVSLQETLMIDPEILEYECYLFGFGAFDIWTLDVNDLTLTNLTDNNMSGFQPQWSPNGDKIVFTSLSNFADCQLDIWLMDADGSNLTNLTSSD